MEYGDKVYELLLKCNRRSNTHDLHSFKADIDSGVVFVDCRGFEVYVQNVMDDGTDNQWCGTVIAAANRLEMFKIDLDSVEI